MNTRPSSNQRSPSEAIVPASVYRNPSEPRSWFGLAALRNALERTGMLLALAALVIVFSVAQPAFLNVDNLFSILQGVSITALLGIGVTLTLAVGGFDLSVGSVAATAQMAASYVLIVWHGSTVEALAACLALGARGSSMHY